MRLPDYDDNELEDSMLDTPSRSDLAADEEVDRRIVLERMYQDWCNEHHLDPEELDTIVEYEQFFTEQETEDRE